MTSRRLKLASRIGLGLALVMLTLLQQGWLHREALLERVWPIVVDQVSEDACTQRRLLELYEEALNRAMRERLPDGTLDFSFLEDFDGANLRERDSDLVAIRDQRNHPITRFRGDEPLAGIARAHGDDEFRLWILFGDGAVETWNDRTPTDATRPPTPFGPSSADERLRKLRPRE